MHVYEWPADSFVYHGSNILYNNENIQTGLQIPLIVEIHLDGRQLCQKSTHNPNTHTIFLKQKEQFFSLSQYPIPKGFFL